MTYVKIVFDGPPGPEAGRFVEVENPQGKSVNVGEWWQRPDGYWALRIVTPMPPPETLDEKQLFAMWDAAREAPDITKCGAMRAAYKALYEMLKTPGA